MRHILTFVAILGVSLTGTAGSAQSGSTPEVTINFKANLVSAFKDICLDKRGNWDAAIAAAESSAFNFQKNVSKKGKELDYIAFPLWVGLKQEKHSQHTCLAQSIIEDSPEGAAERLAEDLKALGYGLEDIEFSSMKSGLIASLPKNPSSTEPKAKPEFLEIRLEPSPLADGVIAVLAIYPK